LPARREWSSLDTRSRRGRISRSLKRTEEVEGAVQATARACCPDGPRTWLTEGSYGTALDRFNEVTFEPVMARGLKLEVRLQNGFSGGILEWTAAAPK
jgi:hypothetical protein